MKGSEATLLPFLPKHGRERKLASYPERRRPQARAGRTKAVGPGAEPGAPTLRLGRRRERGPQPGSRSPTQGTRDLGKSWLRRKLQVSERGSPGEHRWGPRWWGRRRSE